MGTLKFTKNHEWLDIDGNKAKVGISDYAQHSMGDVVFVELPEIDSSFKQDDEIATIESVKAVSDVYSPIDAKVIGINESLEDEPEQINSDAQGAGWLFEVEIENESQLDLLMSLDDYNEFIKK